MRILWLCLSHSLVTVVFVSCISIRYVLTLTKARPPWPSSQPELNELRAEALNNVLLRLMFFKWQWIYYIYMQYIYIIYIYAYIYIYNQYNECTKSLDSLDTNSHFIWFHFWSHFQIGVNEKSEWRWLGLVICMPTCQPNIKPDSRTWHLLCFFSFRIYCGGSSYQLWTWTKVNSLRAQLGQLSAKVHWNGLESLFGYSFLSFLSLVCFRAQNVSLFFAWFRVGHHPSPTLLDFVQNPLVRTAQHLAGSGAWGILAGGHTIGVGYPWGLLLELLWIIMAYLQIDLICFWPILARRVEPTLGSLAPEATIVLVGHGGLTGSSDQDRWSDAHKAEHEGACVTEQDDVQICSDMIKRSYVFPLQTLSGVAERRTVGSIARTFAFFC